MSYADIDALNWTSLKPVSESLRLYRWRVTHPRAETPALALGTAIHMRVLEPERYSATYAVKPDGMNFATKAGRAWRAEQGDRLILSAAQARVVEECWRSLSEHGPARDLLSCDRVEHVIQWEIDGVACKGRVDTLDRSRLVDLKSSRGLDFFAVDAARMLYHAQLAWYLDGGVAAGVLDEDAEVYLVVVETREPYDCAAYRIPSWVLEIGRRIYSENLARLRVAEHTGCYPGRYPDVVDLDLPRWADPGRDDYDEEGF